MPVSGSQKGDSRMVSLQDLMRCAAGCLISRVANSQPADKAHTRSADGGPGEPTNLGVELQIVQLHHSLAQFHVQLQFRAGVVRSRIGRLRKFGLIQVKVVFDKWPKQTFHNELVKSAGGQGGYNAWSRTSATRQRTGNLRIGDRLSAAAAAAARIDAIFNLLNFGEPRTL